jgi:predicted XRE-type DNA-binding protein
MNNGKKPRDVRIDFEDSSGNVFADLGLENPEELLATAKLIGGLRNTMEKRKLTETAAARRLGIPRAHLAKLLRGNFDLFSDREIKHFTRALRQPSVRSRKVHTGKGGGLAPK